MKKKNILKLKQIDCALDSGCLLKKEGEEPGEVW